METVTATFSIPDWINEGLKTKATNVLEVLFVIFGQSR
jgi:hypothetical protein